MTDKTNKYAGAVPDAYQEYLVPILFDSYARDLASRITVPEQGAILETACGTGVLAEHLLERLGNNIRLVETDLNPAMLENAATRLGSAANVDFKAASGTELPFDDDTFDAVACQFGVMFYPDITLGYREAARVLKPGGQFIFNIWSELEKNGFSNSVHQIALTLDKDNPPDFLQLPYVYSDASVATDQLERAGFVDIQVTQLAKDSKATSARQVALGLAAGSPLAMQLSERGIAEKAVDIIEDALKNEYGEGEIMAAMEAIVIDAKLPS